MALQTRFAFALPRFEDTPERPNIARAHFVDEDTWRYAQLTWEMTGNGNMDEGDVFAIARAWVRRCRRSDRLF